MEFQGREVLAAEALLRSVAVVNSQRRINGGKRKAAMEDGWADSIQSTMHVNPEALGWTRRVSDKGMLRKGPCVQTGWALRENP